MAEGQEQNRTEEATPFKLHRARERGQVARGLDLGFVAALIGFVGFVAAAGSATVAALALAMRRAFGTGIASATDPGAAMAVARGLAGAPLHALALLGGTVVALVLFVEVVQLRGLIFSAFPLKPDFSRMNPAQGLKRLLSPSMLKEAFKSIIKMAAYTLVAWLGIRGALAGAALRVQGAADLARALASGLNRLLFLFIAVGAAIAVLDQVMSRQAFAKQMRMSRRELTRESREREGEPRQKAKRKELHKAFVAQSKGLGQLPGSDVLLVNPKHVAVALAYKPGEDGAPVVRAKGAERHALQLRRAAQRYGIPIIEHRRLARALYAACAPDEPIRPEHYLDVADVYHRLEAQGR